MALEAQLDLDKDVHIAPGRVKALGDLTAEDLRRLGEAQEIAHWEGRAFDHRAYSLALSDYSTLNEWLAAEGDIELVPVFDIRDYAKAGAK